MMKTTRLIDIPWPFRILAGVLLFATYVFWVRPMIDTRIDIDRQTAEIMMHTKIAERTIRNSTENLSLARTIRRELGNVRLDVDENTAIASFLVDVDAAAGRRQIAVLGIEPVRSVGVAPKDETPLAMHVRGHYGDVLHFTGDLSMLRSLVAVRSLNLVRDARTVHAGAAPYIDAIIKIAIIRTVAEAAPVEPVVLTPVGNSNAQAPGVK